MENLKKRIALYAGAVLLGSLVFGYILRVATERVAEIQDEGIIAALDPVLLIEPQTWISGFVIVAFIAALYLVNHRLTFKQAKRFMKGSAKDTVDSALENSRFMTKKEMDFNFPHKEFTKLASEKKDGIPVYAVYNNKRRELDINIASPMHSIIIGATGSGKTTTFINPMIQILGATAAGSSMICTDPKGELFQMHSGYLAGKGYKAMVLDLRDPYSSFRWNPLGDLYDRYQLFLHTGDEIYQRDDEVEASGLELVDAADKYGNEWYEFEGKAYADGAALLRKIKLQRQKIYDEIYEDLNDLISVICPIESEKDPVWEKGARSIIMAVALAMLEDSEDPKLGMTKDKFCFYNINKAISNSEEEFRVLKEYFMGRSKLSKAVGLSRQVLSAADTTLASYMSIAFDKLSMFNDEGLCALTSATDINPLDIANKPVALFLKIPDEKDTRHALAAVFVLSIYKALIKVASSREDLSLPRNVYFLLDEFGNMPKIDKFDKMITVGRSRKIWFNMVVQSFAQLNNVYGNTIADIIKSNCGMKMFIGSNDIQTCEEFSKLCGNMSVATSSISTSAASGKEENVSISTQVQNRPLIYPSELMKLNNKTDTGNAIIVTFGNYPMRTKFTPSYRCPLYKFSQIDMSDVKEQGFYGDEIFYDLEERNFAVMEEQNNEGGGEEDELPPLTGNPVELKFGGVKEPDDDAEADEDKAELEDDDFDDALLPDAEDDEEESGSRSASPLKNLLRQSYAGSAQAKREKYQEEADEADDDEFSFPEDEDDDEDLAFSMSDEDNDGDAEAEDSDVHVSSLEELNAAMQSAYEEAMQQLRETQAEDEEDIWEDLDEEES